MLETIIDRPPPVETLVRRFASRRGAAVLESALFNDGLGRFSFLVSDPVAVIRGRDGAYRIRDRAGERRVAGDGLRLLRELTGAVRVERHAAVPFTGGAVGFLSYDYGRQIERVPSIAAVGDPVDDLHFGIYDAVAAFDHADGRLHLFAHPCDGSAEAALERIRSVCLDAAAVGGDPPLPAPGTLQANFTAAAYRRAVEAARAYIAAGDIYQVNLAQRFACEFDGDPWRLYLRLRGANPAPYAAGIDAGDTFVLSTSPEQLLRKRGRELTTRPIKGTRPRGATREEDARLAAQLQASEKERAELLMIVDLERNDLGRVAEYGSVAVRQMYHLERYASVMHQTAQVTATLRSGLDVYDCLAAMFPGGSVTGAPKVRAMEVIEELEPHRRGAYTGSVGYVGFDGDAEFNVAIRTLQLAGGRLSYHVGSGIVWDSDPEREYQETLDKGRAIRDSLDALCKTP